MQGSVGLPLDSSSSCHHAQSIPFLVYSDVGWRVETLDDTVDMEIEALSEDMRARLVRIAKLIEEKGLERVGEPHVKHLEGRL